MKIINNMVFTDLGVYPIPKSRFILEKQVMQFDFFDGQEYDGKTGYIVVMGSHKMKFLNEKEADECFKKLSKILETLVEDD